MSKKRVDVLMVERGLAPSRTRARALIEASKVEADGALVLKPSETFAVEVELALRELDHPYVSRGGVKLEGALADLRVAVEGVIAADVGASTGGFTDCLLRHGARRVYAIDVGRDQLHARLREDPRVVSMEGVNARELTAQSLPELVDLVVIDASFISLEKLLPAVVSLLAPHGILLALVKPQFEVGPERVGARGVVRDDELRFEALARVREAASSLGLATLGDAESRLAGPLGNREIFALFALGEAKPASAGSPTEDAPR